MKNKQSIMTLGILLLLVAGAVWFVMNEKQSDEVQEESFVRQEYPEHFFELTIYDENIPEQKLELWIDRFEKAKTAVLGSPDGFHFQGVLEIGNIKKLVGDFEGAEAALVFLGQQRPQNSVSFGNLGDLYANFLEQPEKSEAAYLQAIENDRDEVIFYTNLSDLYKYQLAETKGELADDILLEGLEHTPDNLTLLNTLGGYYMETGDNEKAVEYFTKSLEIDPENEAVQKAYDQLTG